jgi:hypothetical protein
MGSDHAELTVLSLGLALRDIQAAHFFEDGEDAGDIPDWVQGSPYLIDDAQRLLNIWKRQLPAEDGSGDETPVDVDPKGKGKAKMTAKSGKRKAKSADDGLDTDERHSA